MRMMKPWEGLNFKKMCMMKPWEGLNFKEMRMIKPWEGLNLTMGRIKLYRDACDKIM